MLAACKAAMDARRMDDELCFPEADSFASSPSDSIDYAIMERAEKVAVTPVSPGWSDVGSWDSVFDISDKDGQSNAIFGKASTMNSTENLIHSQEFEIATYGVENLIIVSHENKIMILPRGQSQNVKKIVQKLETGD